jgi:ureidoacrylate peracid hydrolase
MYAFPLRPAAQALLVVDMQNDFVRMGAPQEVPDARRAIPVIAKLITAFREARRPVLYTRFISGPQRTIMWTWSPECGEELKSCWRGHFRRYQDREAELEGPAVVDELTPEVGDEVIDKYGYGGFYKTPLTDALRARHVEQVVVVGTVTQICVEDTVRGGFHEGFEMVVARDGVASFDSELHGATLKNLAMKFALVVSSGEVVTALRDHKPSHAGSGRVNR